MDSIIELMQDDPTAWRDSKQPEKQALIQDLLITYPNKPAFEAELSKII
ncbi:hypothetical protein [Sporosarcina sp. FSL W7-1283]